MLLVIDVGNSNTSLGVYDGPQLVAQGRLTTDRNRTVDEYGVYSRKVFELAGLDFQAIDAVAIASVVPPVNDTLKRMSEQYFQQTALFVDANSNHGLKIRYEPASDVGADRIVDAVAALEKYGAPCIVADLGTATTIDVVNKDGEFLGGVIAPGMMISAEALFARAAKLPKVDILRPPKVVGTSTRTAMQSGLYHGYIGLVDGLLRKMIDEIGGAPKVVATGGLAKIISTGSEFITIVDDNLLLDGLRMIYERSRREH